MRRDTKNKLLKEIEELRLNFSDDMYKEILKKVLNSNDAEIIYTFKSKIENAPTEILANKIMEYDKKKDLKKDFRDNTWRIKFAKDFGNIDLEGIWINNLSGIYNNRKRFKEFANYDIEKENFYNDILLLSTIEGAPVNEIYDFIRQKIDPRFEGFMVEYLKYVENLDLNLIIEQFIDLDVYKGDSPRYIYDFVLNYYEKINCEQMDIIIQILLEKLEQYHNRDEILKPIPYEAIDILILFLTNIKNLTLNQKRELLKNSLINIDCFLKEIEVIKEEYKLKIKSQSKEIDQLRAALRMSV